MAAENSKQRGDLPFKLLTTPTFQLPDGVEPDTFHRCASEMACIHNMMLRGLNSIYLQAPHIQPQDEISFLQYALCFYKLLHVHHSGEEEYLFAEIEKMSGEHGIMGRNIEQHLSLHSGVEEYKRYIQACLDGVEAYDGTKLVSVIDRFGDGLHNHLMEEISSLLNLKKYGEERMCGFEKKFEIWSKKDTAQLSVSETLTWGFFNHDKFYEDNLWMYWPPAPAPVVFIVRWVTYWVHPEWWRFASCDRYGKLKDQLYALTQGGHDGVY